MAKAAAKKSTGPKLRKEFQTAQFAKGLEVRRAVTLRQWVLASSLSLGQFAHILGHSEHGLNFLRLIEVNDWNVGSNATLFS